MLTLEAYAEGQIEAVEVTKPADITLVIDFGLPVDINVLANDMKMEGATLVVEGIKKSEADVLTDSVEGAFGTATVLESDEIRYSIDKMTMNCEEVYIYGATYVRGEAKLGTCYSTVTVIPATNIYYEDNFVTYEGYKKVNGIWNLVSDLWTTEGTTLDRVQAEDRPGEFSLSGLDANNIYGYDAAYKGMSQYSLGSARKVTVDANTQAYASFKFWGTGFDVVSLTSNTTGTIIVSVYELKDDGTPNYNERVESRIVDTYYGYEYVDGEGWVVNPTFNTPNALYQDPVMKIANLEYGNYYAEITVQYDSKFSDG